MKKHPKNLLIKITIISAAACLSLQAMPRGGRHFNPGGHLGGITYRDFNRRDIQNEINNERQRLMRRHKRKEKQRNPCLEPSLKEPKSCNKCKKGFLRAPLETDSTVFECKPCINNCKECDQNPNQCSECKEKYFLEKPTQCTHCPSGCKTCFNLQNCSTCLKGFFRETLVGFEACAKCPSHCEDCSSGTSCLRCEKGYAVDSVKEGALPAPNTANLVASLGLVRSVTEATR